jgi:hypothetical protein
MQSRDALETLETHFAFPRQYYYSRSAYVSASSTPSQEKAAKHISRKPDCTARKHRSKKSATHTSRKRDPISRKHHPKKVVKRTPRNLISLEENNALKRHPRNLTKRTSRKCDSSLRKHRRKKRGKSCVKRTPIRFHFKNPRIQPSSIYTLVFIGPG